MQRQPLLVAARDASGAWPLPVAPQPPAGPRPQPGCLQQAPAQASAFDRSSESPDTAAAFTDAAATPPCGPAGEHGGCWPEVGADSACVWPIAEPLPTAAPIAGTELSGHDDDGAPVSRLGEGGAQQSTPQPQRSPVTLAQAANNTSPLCPAAADARGDGGDYWSHPRYPVPYPPSYPYGWPWLPRARCQGRYGPAAAPYPPPYPPYRHTWTGAWSSRPYGLHPTALPPPFPPPAPPPHFPYAPYPPRAGPLRPWPHPMAPPLAPQGTAPLAPGSTVQTAPAAGPSPFATAVAAAAHAIPHLQLSWEHKQSAGPEASFRRASSAPFSPQPASTTGPAARVAGQMEPADHPAGSVHPYALSLKEPHSSSACPAPPPPVAAAGMLPSPPKRRRLHSDSGVGSGAGGCWGQLWPAPAHLAEVKPATGSTWAATQGGHHQAFPPTLSGDGAVPPPAAAAAGQATMPQQPADGGAKAGGGGALDWESGLDLDLDLEAFLLGDEAGHQAPGASVGPEVYGVYGSPSRPLTPVLQAATAPVTGPAGPALPRAAPEQRVDPPPPGPSPAPAFCSLGPAAELPQASAAVPGTTAVTHAPPNAAVDPDPSGWAAQGPLPLPSPDAAPTPPQAEQLQEQQSLPKPIRVTVTVAAGSSPGGPRQGGRRRRRGGSEDSDEDYDGENDDDGRRSLVDAALVGGRVVGVFHPAAYLEGGRCIEHEGAMLTRSAFERVGGSNMAKWYRSIKVLPEGCTLGRWLTRQGLPILKGVPRNGKARLAAQHGAGAAAGVEAAGTEGGGC